MDDPRGALEKRARSPGAVVLARERDSLSAPREGEYVLAGGRGKRRQWETKKEIPIKDFRGHDLRRTAASAMASLGVPRLVIGKVLNHVESGITSVYDRHGYDIEKRDALERWARKLRSILEGEAGRVVEFRR